MTVALPNAAAERTRAERTRRLRLVPAALTCWLVTLAAVHAPGHAFMLSVLLWAAVCALLGVVIAHGRGGVVLVALIAGAVAVTQVSLSQEQREDARAAASSVQRGAELRMMSKPDPGKGGSWHADAALASAGDVALAAPVRVMWRGERVADVGDTVRVRGSAQPASAGERAVLTIWADRLERVGPAPPVLAVAAALRDGLVLQAERLPGAGGRLLPGLAVGDTRLVDDALQEQMRATGLTHLTAVSGANCAIVVAVGWGIGWLCCWRRGVRVLLASTALAAFTVLVTPEPSVVRAAIMAGLGMIALLAGRARAGLALLCLAVIVAVWIDPWLVTSVGFLLSVAATAALLLLAPALARSLRRWLPGPVALALAVPLAAQLVCAPILVMLDPSVSVVGVVANLVAAPAAPVATVVGLIACALAGVPVLGTLVASIAWVPAAWIAGTAEAGAAAPIVRVPWPDGPIGVAVLAAVTAIALAAMLRRGGRLRAAVTVTTLLLLGVGGGVVVIEQVFGRAPADWAVVQCDVGQGDAVALRSSGAVLLVDTGAEPRLLDTCLRDLGITRVDVLLLTHFDKDHVGASSTLRGRVGLLVHGPPESADLRVIADVRADESRQVAAGDVGTLGDVGWRVLWPQRGSSVTGNDASVVIEVVGPGVPRTLLLGDLGANAQRALLATGAITGPYDVVKVSHHGSADQEPRLYELARGSVALIGVGADNGYGHPTTAALGMLGSALVVRSDEVGTAAIRLSPDGLTVWRDRGG